jgi:site-specific DNA recombinase
MDAKLITRAHWGDLEGMHFAGLVRLSFEPDLGKEDAPKHAKGYMTGRDIKGRDEQEKDCRGYVEHRNGLYVYTYVEPDTSAFKRRPVRLPDGRTVYRVIRPVFEAALEDLKRGQTPDGQRLDGLVVYDIDRLTRDNRHLEDCIEVVEHFDRPIIDITGTLDLLTDNGRTVARIVVATYNKQSADAGRRIRRKHQALQQAGIPVGGRRPFGWQDDKRTLHPQEAELLRTAARRIIAGASMGGFVVEWNDKGITTPGGKKWTRSNLRFMLRNPRICGLRARKVELYDPDRDRQSFDIEIVRNADGEPVVGQWEPIISVAEWETLTAIIGKNIDHSYDFNSRKYLLTGGVLLCGKPECGAAMRATRILQSAKERRAGMYSYGCPAKSDGGCGGLSINGPKTDEYIVEAVIAKYEKEAQKRNARVAPQPWPREEELIQVRQDLKDLTSAWRARPRQITGARYFALLPGLEQEEQELSTEREQWLARQYAVSAKPVALRQDWPALTLPQQRAYIKEALVCVLVHPFGGGEKRFRGDRLEPVWRGEEV